MATSSPQEGQPVPQAAAIPYRRARGFVEFCLITSAGKGRWGFPKGFVDAGETATETALKEAFEEAGLHGEVEGESLGRYGYRKWNLSLVVDVYLMRVTHEEASWEEAAFRERAWFTADEAAQRLERKALRDLLSVAMQRMHPSGARRFLSSGGEMG